MRPTAWLVQTNITPESPTPAQLQAACAHQARPFHAIHVLPGSTGAPPVPDAARGGPVVFHGRSTLLLNALASPWRHGVFFNPATFRHQAYDEGFGDALLNHGAQVMTWADLLALAPTASGYRFLKPNDDFKGFTGQAMSLSAVPAFFRSLRPRPCVDLLQEKVVVAEAHEVDAEWRLFVVDGQVITGSMYRPAGGALVPRDVMAFAQSVIGAWTPAAVFALDIGRVGGRLKVIECNCFNASRLYDSDANALVEAISSYQEDRFSNLPLEDLTAVSAAVSDSTPITVEPLGPHHAAELHTALLDERLYPFIPEKPPRSLAALEAEYAEFAGGAPAGSGEVWLNWAMRDPVSGACVGTLQATRFASGELWMGYKVVPGWWNKGMATRGVAWLLRELGSVFPGQTVLAAVDTRNTASIRVLEKCGFTRLRREPAELHGVKTEDFIYSAMAQP